MGIIFDGLPEYPGNIKKKYIEVKFDKTGDYYRKNILPKFDKIVEEYRNKFTLENDSAEMDAEIENNVLGLRVALSQAYFAEDADKINDIFNLLKRYLKTEYEVCLTVKEACLKMKDEKENE